MNFNIRVRVCGTIRLFAPHNAFVISAKEDNKKDELSSILTYLLMLKTAGYL